MSHSAKSASEKYFTTSRDIESLRWSCQIAYRVISLFAPVADPGMGKAVNPYQHIQFFQASFAVWWWRSERQPQGRLHYRHSTPFTKRDTPKSGRMVRPRIKNEIPKVNSMFPNIADSIELSLMVHRVSSDIRISGGFLGYVHSSRRAVGTLTLLYQPR